MFREIPIRIGTSVDGALRVPAGHRDRRLEDREEPVRSAFGELRGVPLGPHQEPAADGGLAPDEVLDREATGSPPGACVVPCRIEGRVGLGPEPDRLAEIGAPPGGVGEPLEIGAGHRPAIGRPVRLVGGDPVLPGQRLAGTIELRHGSPA